MISRSEIIQRLEKATEPSRELIYETWFAIRLPDFDNIERERGMDALNAAGAPHFNRLLNGGAWFEAALTLLPKDRTLHLCMSMCGHILASVKLWKHLDLSGAEDFEVEAPVAAHAVCIAALKAGETTS